MDHLTALLENGRLAAMRITACAAVAATVSLSGPSALSGQQEVFSGRVVDEATEEPVQGAIVGAETAASVIVGQTLTNDTGNFLLRLPAGASFDRIHVERIGYRTQTFERSALPPEGSWQLRVGTEPISVEGVGVVGENLCGSALRNSRGVMAIWEEARKSLRVTQLSREIRITGFETEQFERRFDGDGQPLGTGTARTRNVRADKPYRTLTVNQMTRDGWVHGTATGGLTYYAPDAFLLLSEEFTDQHCFSAEVGDDGTFLRFEPNSARRDHTEVQGVLELDPATLAPRELRFRYVGLSNTGLRRAQVAEEAAGGRVVFYGAPNGIRVVQEWSIRTPILSMVQRRVGTSVVNQLQVDEIREQGGRIRRVLLDGEAMEVPRAP